MPQWPAEAGTLAARPGRAPARADGGEARCPGSPALSRRQALQAMGLVAAGSMLGLGPVGCGSQGLFKTRPAIRAPRRRLAPVRVSADRVIREVVGLRPFRASGFALRAETLGDKLLVHNYGHGGAGLTLSWGTAQLAIEEVLSSGRHGPVAVLGCGVIGLSTARLLQRHGFAVTIYARDLPPDTTSNVAGGLWYPSLVVESSARTAGFERLLGIAGGSVVVRELRDACEVTALPEPMVVNCTGLGARDLFGDRELVPVKGQLVVLAPQTEVDYGIGTVQDLYMIPRRDGILLGGTHQEGVETLEPDPRERGRILEQHRRIFDGMRAR